MDRIPSIDDGYRVVLADTTHDDRTSQHKTIGQTRGNVRKFRSFLFPAKYHDQTITTAQDLVRNLKPQARVIPFSDKNTSQLVYDRAFFATIECGEQFVDFWDQIVAANPKDADSIMTRLFRAISQTALKIEYMHKKYGNQNSDLYNFFESYWHHDSNQDNHYQKFLKKLGELDIKQQGHTTTMAAVYAKLCKDFPQLPWYVENICQHTFLHIHGKIDFGLLGVLPDHISN